ncbi:alpha/beta hydrolase [Agromyces subbeticus]|uniref:alpha/beta hydrolase n=1 Tax=Agromyces subbeticus TaxID=293890 RepID=UPI0003B30BDB|nr:alpha/beta hydrolase [Agromyces subbeticus]
MSQVSMPYAAADGLVRVYPAGTDAAPDAAEAAPRSALVWAHGGGFAGGDLGMPEADWVARSLAERGITVVSVDYRHAGHGFRYPVPSDDVLTAWRWTLDHADELGIDPARLAIGGASAGGNLVTGAVLRLLADATTTTTERIRPLPAGVFLAYPTLLDAQPAPDASLRALLDANPEADRSPSYVHDMYENYFGAPVVDAPLDVAPGRAAASDLAEFPPVLMINSEIDHLRVSGEVFADTLAEARVPLELFTEPGALHGHLNRPGERAASDSIERIMRWIARGFIPDAAPTTTPTTLRTTEGLPS